MAEATATPETEVEESSTPSTPESTPQPESESPENDLEVTPSAEVGSETPDEEPEPETPVSKPLDQWTLQELNEKAYSEGLSAEETRRRDSLQQSHNDRVQAWQRQVQEQEQAETKRLEELKELGTTTRQNIKTAIQTEIEAAANAGREPDLALIEERIERHIANLDEKAGEKHLAPYETSLGKLLLSDGVYGDSPQNRKAVEQMNLTQRIHALTTRMHELGRMQGPGEGYVVKSQKDYDKELADAAKKAVDDYKAANPGASAPSTRGVRPGRGQLVDPDSIPTNDWIKKPVEEREQIKADWAAHMESQR